MTKRYARCACDRCGYTVWYGTVRVKANAVPYDDIGTVPVPYGTVRYGMQVKDDSRVSHRTGQQEFVILHRI